MARNRANIDEGQSAYVGNIRFGPRQLLPQGTTQYEVKGWYQLDSDETWRGGPKGIAYSFTVEVGTSRADVEEMTLTAIEIAKAEESAYYYPTLDEQASLFSDIG